MPRPDSVRQLAVTTVVVCAASLAVVHAWRVTLAALGALVLIGGLAFARQAIRHQRLTRGLLHLTRPAELGTVAVRLGPVRDAAFVAGLARPHIFCDVELTTRLSSEELRAVTLHERAHQVARDPLRMALLAVVAPLVRLLPAGPAWLERQAARREIAADRAALAQGVSRAAVTSALLKVGRFEPAGVPGFAPAVDLRIRALLDGDAAAADQQRPARWRVLLAGSLLAAVACLLVLHTSPLALTVSCC